MTNRFPRTKCIPLFLFLLMIMSPSRQAQTTEATIEYYRDGTTRYIKFTSEDLLKIQNDAYALKARLEAEGVSCCPPQKQISDCIWRCCDGAQISTCDEILTTALKQIWGSSDFPQVV